MDYIEKVSGDLSRSIAGAIFPNSSNGRSLSKMTADGLGMSVDQVHLWGVAFIGAWLLSKR